MTESKSENAVIFEKVVNYMEDNIDKNPSMQDFAKYANVSVSTLKRIFSKYAYIGVHSYFQTIKIQKAKVLLRQGESVYSVSKQLGYSNQNNFSLSFKKAVGTSPSLYKAVE